jgi:hypothetical protein
MGRRGRTVARRSMRRRTSDTARAVASTTSAQPARRTHGLRASHTDPAACSDAIESDTERRSSEGTARALDDRMGVTGPSFMTASGNCGRALARKAMRRAWAHTSDDDGTDGETGKPEWC